MNNISKQSDVLKALKENKVLVQQEIQESKTRISDKIHAMTEPVPRATNKVQGIGQIISNGMAIYEGIRIGISIISAFRTLFGKKKRR